MTNHEYTSALATALAFGGITLRRGQIDTFAGTPEQVLEFLRAFSAKQGNPLSGPRAIEVWREFTQMHMNAARAYTRVMREPVVFRICSRVGFERESQPDPAQQLATVNAA